MIKKTNKHVLCNTYSLSSLEYSSCFNNLKTILNNPNSSQEKYSFTIQTIMLYFNNFCILIIKRFQFGVNIF